MTMLRKFLLLLIYLSTACYYGFTQSKVDSLTMLLSKQGEDTTRVKLYLEFFYTDLFYDDPQQIVEYAKQALSLSQKIDYAIGEVESCTTLGYMYRIRSENDSAFLYFDAGLKKAEQIAYLRGQFDALSGMGNTNNRIGKWEKAIEYFKKVEVLGREFADTVMISSANNNIGNTYLTNGQLTKALKHFQVTAELAKPLMKGTAFINIGLVHIELNNLATASDYLNLGLEIAKESENLYNEAFIYKHLGNISLQQNNRPGALGYYQQASTIFASIDERYHGSDLLGNIANIHLEDGAYEKALDYYNRSLEIQSEIDHFLGQCKSNIGLGKTYLALKDYERAKLYLLKANRLADEHSLLTAKDNVVESLSLLFSATGDYQKALEYQVLLGALSDSILNLEKSKQIAQLETQYETSKKEKEIELLSAQNQISTLQLEQQQNLRNYLIITAIFLLILSGVLYNRYQIKARANHKLKELDEIKTSFFTNISHEFRTPLTLILSPIQNLLRNENGRFSKSDQQELEVVQRSATNLLDLTNQLMDLSKLEAGKLTLRVSQGDLNTLIKTVAASFESLASSNNIRFNCELTDIPDKVYFDGDNLQKVLNNLLSNAFKFTPQGGEVSIKGSLAGDYIEIVVKDSGSGIPKEEINKIFSRFYQSNGMSQSTGTGVGLALTQELAALHHGKIEVNSEVKHGSTFTFSFPHDRSNYAASELTNEEETFVVLEKEGESRDYDPEEALLDPAKPVVLIVEDNQDLRRHLRKLLNGLYTVREAENGEEGLHQATGDIPDIVISDLMMPKMDGITLCNELKANEKTSHIPIILLTAKSDQDSKLDGLKQGADDYLVKPFDNDELHIRIDNLIKQRNDLRLKYSQVLRLEPSKIEVKSPDEEFIKRALEVVDQHLSETDFTVEQFQTEMGMSRMQLHRKLKALTQFSASEFVRDIRLKRAANLLEQNDMNVAQAAYSCGFNSVSYFTRCFKEKYAITPSEFSHKAS